MIKNRLSFLLLFFFATTTASPFFSAWAADSGMGPLVNNDPCASIFFIGIAGGSASGKTTVAHGIQNALEAGSTQILSTDDYYRVRPPGFKVERINGFPNYDLPQLVDWELLETHLRELCAGRSIAKPSYDFSINNRSAVTTQVNPSPVVIVEGLHTLLFPEVRRFFGLRVFVDASHQVRLVRRVQRDSTSREKQSIEELQGLFSNVIAPMHDLHVAPQYAKATFSISSDRPEYLGPSIKAIVEAAIQRCGNRVKARALP